MPIKKLKKKIVDVTSDLLSAPARFKSNQQIKTGTYETNILKEARNYKKGSYDEFDKKGKPTRQTMVVSEADRIRDKYKKK